MNAKTGNKWHTRAWKNRLHGRLVLAQLAGIAASIGLMGETGFGRWTFAALGLTVMFMLASMALQLRWRLQDLGAPRLTTSLAPAKKPEHPVLTALSAIGQRS